MKELLINPYKLAEDLAHMEIIKLYHKKYPDLTKEERFEKMYKRVSPDIIYTDEAIKPFTDFVLFYTNIISKSAII